MHIPLSQVLARKFVAVLPADATVMTVNGQKLHAETKTTHNSFGKMRVNSRKVAIISNCKDITDWEGGMI